jgi:PAS domain S-box-containing protein
LKTELDQIKSELRAKDENLTHMKQEMENKAKDITELKVERDRLSFCLHDVNNMLPSSVIMVNRDGIVTSWNKKAEEMLGLEAGKAVGKNLFEIELMGKERLREGLRQCQKEKKSVTVKSISIKNQRGDVSLTDISHMPVLDSHGESQGAVMVINDVSEIAKIQAELEQKQQDLKNLDNRFQEVYTKLKLTNRDKAANSDDLMKIKTDIQMENRDKEHMDNILNEKKRELESLSKSIELKTSEFDSINTKLQEDRSVLNLIGTEVEKKQKEIEIDGTTSETWKEKLKIYDEIGKCLDVSDDKLKTKKISDEEPK